MQNKLLNLSIASLFKRSAFLSFKWATVSSILITLVMVLWEWLENPAGIFRNDKGTQWQFVYDTAISWFVPTLGYLLVMGFVISLLLLSIRQLKAK